MPKREKRNEIIKEVLSQYPEMASRTLARLLHDKYPHEFLTVEEARSTLRYWRGRKGDLARQTAGLPEITEPIPIDTTPPKMPEGIKQGLPSIGFNGPGKWLIVSDLHIPYHDERAIEAAIKAGRDAGCDSLCVNGDFLDFYQISDFTRDPRLRSPSDEMDVGRDVLTYLEHQFTGLRVFKVGNHDDRFERYLWRQAPALVGIADFEFHKVMKFEERGWQYIRSKQHYKIGQLNIFHGHELPRGLTDPVNVGRGLWLRAREAALCGHWHKTSTHLESAGVSKKVTACYSVGCLCDLSPEYATVNSWTHGFAIVSVDAAGHYHVQNRTVVDGQVYATE